MNAKEWDAHERGFCNYCAHDGKGRKACPIRKYLHMDPNDAQASFFIKQGQCSQYKRKEKKKG